MSTKVVKESFLKKAFEISRKLIAYEVLIDSLLSYRTLARRLSDQMNDPLPEHLPPVSDETKANYLRAKLVVHNLLTEMERPLAYLTLSYNVLNSEIEFLKTTGQGSAFEFNVNTRRIPILRDELLEYLDRINEQFKLFEGHPQSDLALKALKGFNVFEDKTRLHDFPEVTDEDIHA